MARRMQLTPDEQAIIEGLRHEKAIWNEALTAAIATVQETFGDEGDPGRAIEKIMRLRK